MKREAPTAAVKSHNPSRRAFLEWGGKLAGASALAAMAVPPVHAAEDNTLRLALIGCGGRGSGAVANAMNAPGGPVKLVAMADLFEQRQTGSYQALAKQFPDRVDVPPERRFLGFDAYRKAIDCLRPGDIAILATYAAFRPPHLEYAVAKGVHVFMEKQFAVDPVAVRRIIKAGEAAQQKNLKIAAGLMCRHSTARQALIQRIREGALGPIQLVRAYRMEGRTPLVRRPAEENELLGQIRSTERIFWVSGGTFADRTVHLIDEICWLKDAWPVAAHGVGGRRANNVDAGQDLDAYSVEYTFADGTKAMAVARYAPDCFPNFATYVHGTKCAAQFSGAIHAPTVHLYKDQRMERDNIVWEPEKERIGPHQAEWNVLLDAIRNDRPHNEARRAALANLATIIGRAAVHSGRIITWDEAMASNFQFCPNIDNLNADGPAPAKADSLGRYPAPIPGQWSEI
jgi:predicted dehydrogenase